MGEEDRSGFALRSLLTIAAPIALGFSLGGLIGRERVVLSPTRAAWRCPFEANWSMSGGLICCQEIT